MSGPFAFVNLVNYVSTFSLPILLDLFRISLYFTSTYLHALFQDHQEKDCQEIPCSCENNCGLTAIPRCKLAEHYSKYCPNTVWTCPFSFAGCCFKVNEIIPAGCREKVSAFKQQQNKNILFRNQNFICFD